jgi:hypothetical protein
MTCDLVGGERRSLIFEIGAELTNLRAAWELSADSCEAIRDPGPLTPRERQAVDTAGYTDEVDVALLYALCGRVQSDDPYLLEGVSLSDRQIIEVNSMLALCPGHPLAGRLQAAVTRTQERAQLEAAGHLFADGTHLVGTEVQPGTYVVDGKVADCYWARMDARGEIIDNNFISGAGRAEVTIRAGDHSFTSEGCGEWRKVG